MNNEPLNPIVDQPPPRQDNTNPDVADLVCEDLAFWFDDAGSKVIDDMRERKRLGVERYGVPLRPFNGRDALIDLYQEMLDALQYYRQLIYEAWNREHPLNQYCALLSNHYYALTCQAVEIRRLISLQHKE